MRHSDSQFCEICHERIEDVAEAMLCSTCGNLIHKRCIPVHPPGTEGTCATCGCSLLTEAAVRLRTEREREARAAQQSRLPALLPWLLAVAFGVVGCLGFGAATASAFPAPPGGGFNLVWLTLTGAGGAVCAALGWAIGSALQRRRKRRRKDRR